jgi:hypothetical protein
LHAINQLLSDNIVRRKDFPESIHDLFVEGISLRGKGLDDHNLKLISFTFGDGTSESTTFGTKIVLD